MRVLMLGLLMGISAGMMAQPGVRAHIPQLAGNTVALSAYTGLDLIVLDSIQGDEKGFFQYDSLLPEGMYVLDGEGFNMEFLSVGIPLEWILEDIAEPTSARFIDAPENTRWAAYLALRDQFRYGYEDPVAFMRLTDSLVAGSSDYAARLILSDRDPRLQASDFMDPTLIPTNVLTTKIVHDLETSNQEFVVEVDHILALAKVNMDAYEFALQYLLKGFTAMGLSEVTDHLLNFPQLAEGEISAEEGLRLERLTEPYQRVRVGVKAPDIVAVSIEGKPYHLYESEAPYVIVFFWAADCEYCHDFLTSIRQHLDLDNEYELVTFAIADNEREVRRELRKLRVKGIHCYDEARWEGKAFLDYHVMSTPTAFVLDRDKTIIAKPYDWEEMRIKN